jgi:hypothetical protein
MASSDSAILEPIKESDSSFPSGGKFTAPVRTEQANTSEIFDY